MSNQQYLDLYLMQNSDTVFIKKNGKKQMMFADRCIHQLIKTPKVNIYWDMQNANMTIQPSQALQLSHQINGKQQIIRGVDLYHSQQCPLLNQKIQINPKRKMKPCAVTMILNAKQDKILVTKRSQKLFAFPGAWVLPGGHLQKNQTIIEGGLRECEQEVGLPNNLAKFDMKKPVMAWQSIFYADDKVKASALVIFFTADTSQYFEVKVQQKQVSQFKWKNLADQSDEERYHHGKNPGYGQAHLKYLRLSRQFCLKK